MRAVIARAVVVSTLFVVAWSAVSGCTSQVRQSASKSRESATPSSVAASQTALKALTKPCANAPGLLCGSINVPIDRTDPSRGTIPISFQFRPHDDASVRATSTTVLFPQPGRASGAGGIPQFILNAYGPILHTTDILGISPRGTGPTAVDCPKLQAGGVAWDEAVSECIAVLGKNRDFYQYGDLATDEEAVRKALHIDKVDVVAIGFGRGTAEAYLARFPEHVRAMLLDSPRLDTVWYNPEVNQNGLRMIGLQCTRSPSCASAYKDPADGSLADIMWLLQRLRQSPITGDGVNADGEAQRVYVDETAFAWMIDFAPSFPAIASGELPAAARALRHGDAAPLLRLAAEAGVDAQPTDISHGYGGYGSFQTDSEGALDAAYCADVPTLYDRSATPQERIKQAADAVAQAQQMVFAPFDRRAVTLLAPDPECVRWPAPVRVNPIIEPGKQFRRVPTLILTGDMNGGEPIINSQRVADRHPGAINVLIPNASHAVMGTSDCAARILRSFLSTLSTGPTTCSVSEQLAFPAVGVFGREAQSYPPARVVKAKATSVQRRAVSVAVATWLDAERRAQYVASGTSGVGLRGGVWSVESSGLYMLKNLQLVDDVTVSGTIGLDSGGTLTVNGPGPLHGTVVIPAGVNWTSVSTRSIVVTADFGHEFLAMVPIR